ncbi:hypothetical protein NQZ68_018807 [Dissostichus eleginoides]|nr:hypothetical protein NQZ68_018807 [Dissostichus eleginoides]
MKRDLEADPLSPGALRRGAYTEPPARLSAGDRPAPLGSRDRPPASVDGPEKSTAFPFEQPPPPPLSFSLPSLPLRT